MDNLRYQPPRESLGYLENPVFCEDHPHEPITNFCFTTLKPLCPACIDPHNKTMKQKGAFPEIATIRSVKANCTKKCQNAILALESELGHLDGQMIVNPKTVVEEGIFQIRRARDRLISFINKYAEDLEAEYERSVHEAVSHATGYSDVGEKVHDLVRELETLIYNIETPGCIPAIQKVCRIDFQALLDKFRHDIRHTLDVRENLAHNFSEVVVNDSLFAEATDTIQRYIHLGRKSPHHHDDVKSPYGTKSPGQSYIRDDPDLLKYHKEYRNNPEQVFEINQSDYFDQNCPRKYLHFFQNHENRFHFIDVTTLGKQQSKPVFESIGLSIDFKIPPFHKSIIVPNGEIYLIGGSEADDPSRKLNSTYLFDWSNYTLIPKAPLNVSRSSFAICYMNRSIYVAGGLTNNSNFTRKCERYDIVANKWTPIADLNFDVLAPCMTAFNNKYIYKFGGYKGDFLERYVEKYDPAKNVWTTCHIRIELTVDVKPEYFKILSTSACVQINPKEIYVFGGYLEDNTSSNQTFVFRVNKDDDDQNPQNYLITKVGVKTLTNPEAFWNNTPLVFNKKVYALQNVQTSEQEDVCLDDKRRLICFDSFDWSSVA